MAKAKWFLVPVAVAALAALAVAPPAEGAARRGSAHERARRMNLIEVGRTRDACSRGNDIRFRGANGDVHVAANASEVAQLPAVTKELIFYCGGSRERCANDVEFDYVLCERAGNGAIQWVFYRKP